MRPFDGDFAGLTSLRLRRLGWFLRRWNLFDTAYALEQETGVYFKKANLNVMLYECRWVDAEAYVRGFVDLADPSPLASTILTRLRITGVMAKFARGQAITPADEAWFRRINAAFLANPNPKFHALGRTLLSMRSDRDRALREYSRVENMARNAIMKWADDCPELKAKSRPPPRCMFNLTYILSLGPKFWECKRRGQKRSNAGRRRIPARLLARQFTRTRMSSVAALPVKKFGSVN